jgi:hypothetical protein
MPPPSPKPSLFALAFVGFVVLALLIVRKIFEPLQGGF